MCGCDRRAAAIASRWKRVWNASSAARCGSRSFTATGRARTSSSASHTSAMPPRARRRTRRYRPPMTAPSVMVGESGKPDDRTRDVAVVPRRLLHLEGDAGDARAAVGADRGTDDPGGDLVARHDGADELEQLV